MNAFWGADPESLRTLGAVTLRRSELLADVESLLSATIDGVEWIGEDAERLRADWAGIVRPGLLDRSVELRHHARRLQQHADEQEAASSPDGPSGGWSSAGAFGQDVARLAQEAIRDLLGVAPQDLVTGLGVGSGLSSLIGESGEVGSQGLLDRVLEILGDVVTPGDGSGAVIGDGIGFSGLDGARR